MNLWFTLHLDLSANASDGPGWYLSAHRRDVGDELPVTLVEPLRLNSDQLRYFEAISIPGKLSTQQIVSSGSHLIKEAIDTQIEEAEAAAERAAKLKALRDAEQTNDKDVKE